MKYIWISFVSHPERQGQFCEIEIHPSLSTNSHITAIFSDGERIKGTRTNVRIDSPENRKKYVRQSIGETKVCTKCKKTKDLSEFLFVKARTNHNAHRKLQCYACESAAIRYSGKTSKKNGEEP